MKLRICGHGLAGALLAEKAHQRGVDVAVHSDGGAASSRVAAGMFTPVTGKRFVPTWRLGDFWQTMHDVYQGLEHDLGVSFFHLVPTLRLLSSDDKVPDLSGVATARARARKLESHELAALPVKRVIAAIEIQNSGWVDLPILLDKLTERRRCLGQWSDSPFETVADDTIICSCGGQADASHPLWSQLGWRLAHGTVLTIRAPDLPKHAILNAGKFVQPIGDDLFRCGATYDWASRIDGPTLQGIDDLTAFLNATLTVDWRLEDALGGVRPVALQRVPVMGPHPDNPQQWILNGFASKGVLQAPRVCEEFLDALLENAPIHPEMEAAPRIARQQARLQTAQGQAKRRS